MHINDAFSGEGTTSDQQTKISGKMSWSVGDIFGHEDSENALCRHSYICFLGGMSDYDTIFRVLFFGVDKRKWKIYTWAW